jgi:outer membrane receptor protein involved in Fe transport
MSMTTLKSRRARLLSSTGLAVAGALLASSTAYADDQVETVVITGSRLAVTSAFDAPTPVSVISAEQIQLTGTVNIETLLNQSPQFTGATNGSPSSNTQQANGNSGAAYADLRNLNPGSNTPRTLVLVNGRRFTINGTSLATDLNTIPAALVQRTEVVTGGSSAVYGSDAIAGVVNFVLRQDYTGAEARAHVNFDAYTTTPEYSFDLTAGSNFDHDRGNVVMSANYTNRGGIRQSQVSYAKLPFNETCVTAASWMRDAPGIANGSNAANCAASGGKMGFTQGGSTSTPPGQFLPVFTGSDATLTTLLAAAGIPGGNFTFDGTTARPVSNPADLYNLTAQNFMQIPQERWMLNSFAHYDLTPHITAYAEMHFSNNSISVQLTPSNLGGQSILVNTNNPYLSAAMQAVLVRLDQLETANTSIVEGSKTFTTAPNDGFAILKMSRRFVELGNRTDDDNRVAWRFAGGFRGNIGSPFGDAFLKDLSYDIYYDYARTIDTNWLSGVGSRSAIQNSILEPGANPPTATGSGTPVCNIFGPNMSAACIKAVSITDQYTTKAEQAGAVASLTGTAVELPAGPAQFSVGLEWRFDSAQYIPDQYLATGEPTGFNYSYPTKGNTSVKEVFGEVRVPVLKDILLIKSFTANAAFRNSCYNLSGVGCVWTYSAGGDWKITDDIALRGQFQHAIRAPNVGELYGGSALNFQSNTIDPCGGQYAGAHTAALQALCVATGVPAGNVWTNVVQDASKLVGYTSGGNPNLAQEASDTITFGTVFTPTFVPGLQASVDFFSIDIKGAIGVFGGSANAVLNNCYLSSNTDPANLNCAAINRDSSGAITAPYYINLGNVNANFLKTQGVDVGTVYTFDPGFGLLSGDSTFTVSSNWTITTEFKSVGTTGVATSCLGQFGGTCLEPLPNWKGVSNVTWHDGPLTLNLRWRLIGQTTDDRHKLQGTPLAAMTNPVIPVYNYFDLSGSYDITENLTVTGGVNNLFGLEPPTPAKTSYGNTWPATYDAFGQMMFINVVAKTN